MYPQIGSIDPSSLHKHLVLHASLTFKKLEPIVSARTAQRTMELRRERVLEWQNDNSMDWSQNCIFTDEAGFNLHIRRNFGRSKKGMPVKSVVPSNRRVTVTIIGAIFEKGVVELTLRKPKAVQKKNSGIKKRKRGSGKADEVEVNARGRYLVMDNAATHKVDEVQELIASRGYKVAYLPPYSPFLNPIELFWLMIKGSVRRNCLSADDNLSPRITEAAKKVTQQDCANWISHSQSFFDRYL
ncbi:hypothetical protein RMATCC62417_15067 [Rhizopus microsporus]|nr:hypothetical protein RMATCC62417_15067 [Rhizopus microsporus]